MTQHYDSMPIYEYAHILRMYVTSDIRERQSLHDNVVADKVAEENIGGGEEVSIVRVDQAQAGIVLESEAQGIGKHGSKAFPIKAKPPWPESGNDSGDSGYCQLGKL